MKNKTTTKITQKNNKNHKKKLEIVNNDKKKLNIKIRPIRMLTHIRPNWIFIHFYEEGAALKMKMKNEKIQHTKTQ